MRRAKINARYAKTPAYIPPMEGTTKVNKQLMVTVVSSMQYVVEFSEWTQYNITI